MADYAIKLGDTLPVLRAILYGPDGAPSDLTGYSGMVFRVRRADAPGTTVVERAVSIDDPASGAVSVPWEDGDTEAMGEGEVEGEFKVEVGGEPVTWPSEGYVTFRVWADLDAVPS